MKTKIIKIIVLTAILAGAVHFLTAETALSAEQPDFNILIGEWVRTDGGYIIRVHNIKPDGTANAEYLNPKKINISESTVSLWKGLIRLFIKLEDEGYPGSAYTLYYYAEKDALAGFYYQAAMKKNFEVVFFRK